jgi:Flp pilus assembly protein TadG
VKTYRGNQTLHSLISALRGDRRGQIAIMFGLSALMIVTGVGAGVDLMRAYLVQQKVTHVATLTCQYASSSPVQNLISGVYGTVGSLTKFQSTVTSYLTSSWATQQIPYAPTVDTFTPGTNGNSSVTVATNVPTTFMQIANVLSIPVGATVDCYGTTGPTQQTSGTIVQEGFESAPCGAGAVCYISPTGTFSDNTKVPATFQPYKAGSNGYQGTTAKWYITGYCLETDGVGLVSSKVPEGQTAAELDCDNGSGTAGNSAISTQAYLEVGNYELRWFYRSRIDYPDYDPAYICGNSAADTSWANDTNTPGFVTQAFSSPHALRTNQINVYLDPPLGSSSGAPPTHYTLDGKEQLAGSNLIDTCVYSPVWIERSVRINVATAGNYWLTFAADGANDSYGGQIDDIRLCAGTCAGTPQDNFPSLSYNPFYSTGGSQMVTAAELPNWVDLTLFKDTFESPSYPSTVNAGSLSLFTNPTGNLNLSLGTSGASSGWPGTSTSGWATAPSNGVSYNSALAAQGLQNVWLNGSNGAGVLTARQFLLVPGYYSLSYSYASNVIFPTVLTASCGATPSAANLGSSGTLSGSATGYLRTQPLFPISGSKTTNTLAAFITNAQLASEPITGGALNSTTSYTNPDSNLSDTPPATTTSTTPTVKPDAISLTNYTASSTSALVDICGYSPVWLPRTVYFEITKTGYYWLNFSTEMATPASYGGGTVVGGAIDNVQVAALGSLNMLSPPSNPVVVPVGGPQPGSQIYYSANQFLIVADPLTVPAPQQ